MITIVLKSNTRPISKNIFIAKISLSINRAKSKANENISIPREINNLVPPEWLLFFFDKG